MKKVREEQETDIKHLRKLNHQNIVTFKYVWMSNVSSFMRYTCRNERLFSIIEIPFTEAYALKHHVIV